MIKVLHRVNSLDELKKTDKIFGVEVDIHAYGGRLVVTHNAFSNGIDFHDWLSACNARLVIFNIKEEGIESKVYDMAIESGIQDFFLLDLSFPALIKMSRKGCSNIAIRVSEYESVDSALLLQHQVKWVWLDCFNGFPLSADEVIKLNNSSFKICLVSPELHDMSRLNKERFQFKKDISLFGLNIDAVCTKIPDIW
jgi:hypothetical protein